MAVNQASGIGGKARILRQRYGGDEKLKYLDMAIQAVSGR
jgi:hypothetical protein